MEDQNQNKVSKLLYPNEQVKPIMPRMIIVPLIEKSSMYLLSAVYTFPWVPLIIVTPYEPLVSGIVNPNLPKRS